LSELRKLGVEEVVLEGRVEISGLRVLGKGCVSLVVVARCREGEAALKIRRVDANRPSLSQEAELQSLANRVAVGPKLYNYSDNFILMELIRGVNLPEWVRNLKGRGMVSNLRRVCRDLLAKCWRLDQAHLDHGELSNLSKHVIVGDRVEIIDFESASTKRSVRNLTSAAQYLFIGGPVASKIRRVLNLKERNTIIEAIRSYKRERGSEEALQLLLKRLRLVERHSQT
jgi:putative serine/threonine protein kinase